MRTVIALLEIIHRGYEDLSAIFDIAGLKAFFLLLDPAVKPNLRLGGKNRCDFVGPVGKRFRADCRLTTAFSSTYQSVTTSGTGSPPRAASSPFLPN